MHNLDTLRNLLKNDFRNDITFILAAIHISISLSRLKMSQTHCYGVLIAKVIFMEVDLLKLFFLFLAQIPVNLSIFPGVPVHFFVTLPLSNTVIASLL